MSVNGRSPSKLLVFALALPIFGLVYVTTFGARFWAALRPAVATFLGATVIGSLYVETAYRKTPTPIRAAAVVALSVALVAPSFSAPQTVAAASPAEAVIAAAKQYLDHRYQLGAEGPREFDCSGLIYRAFSDAGELPRVGGMRLRAAGYMQYFVSRGRFTKDASQAERGDLVVYDRGSHIGIYLGGDQVISALVNPWGVTVHSLHGVHLSVTYFLHVNWGGGDASNPPDDNGGNSGGNNAKPDVDKGSGNSIDHPDKVGNANPPDNNGGNGDGDNDGNGNSGGDGDTPTPDPGVKPGIGTNAFALGTMNLRTSADPASRIIGWIGRGGTFKIVDTGTSPAGYKWFQVQTKSGKEGWVYSRWVQELS
jgi:cell wall-associated NlpC family hydrolase